MSNICHLALSEWIAPHFCHGSGQKIYLHDYLFIFLYLLYNLFHYLFISLDAKASKSMSLQNMYLYIFYNLLSVNQFDCSGLICIYLIIIFKLSSV